MQLPSFFLGSEKIQISPKLAAARPSLPRVQASSEKNLTKQGKGADESSKDVSKILKDQRAVGVISTVVITSVFKLAQAVR